MAGEEAALVAQPGGLVVAAAIAAEVASLPADRVLSEIERSFPELLAQRWRLALLAERAEREELWREAGCSSMAQWARLALKRDPTVAGKWITSARYLLTLAPEEQQRVVETTPPVTLAEARVPELAKHDPAEALQLATSGLSQSKLKQAVRIRLPRQHFDPDTLADLHLQCRSEDAETVNAALAWIQFQFHQKAPAQWQLVERLLLELGLKDWWSRQALDPDVEQRFPLEVILRGEVYCIECGSRNAADLERHHVVLRSHQGHDGPLVYLCSTCHEIVTRNLKGTWRQWARRWARRRDLGWFRTALDAWLSDNGFASLEAIP